MLAGPTVEELAGLVELTRTIAAERGLERPSLGSNVGAFQSVRQLHFHLLPGGEFAPLEERSLAFGASSLRDGSNELAELTVTALDAARSVRVLE